MSWIVIIWAMTASACLTVGLMHFVVWLKQPSRDTHLSFVAAAIGAALMAAMELLMMRAETVEQFGVLLRWSHVPVFILVVSIVVFVRGLFGTGRLWLAWTVCGLRALSLIVNFFAEINLNYVEITGLRQIRIWGESIAVAEGAQNPWIWLGQGSSLLLLIFVIDASVSLWRRDGDAVAKRRALLVGGSVVFFIVASALHSALLHAGVIASPYLISAAFLSIVLVMGYELGVDVIRSSALAVELRASESHSRAIESRMDLAIDAAGLGTWEWDVARDEVRISDRSRALLGLTGSAPVDFAAFLNRVAPPDRDRVREAVHKCLENGVDPEMEFRAVSGERSDGVRWMFSRGRVELDTNGKPALMRGVVLDVTQRRQMEADAREQRDELTHLSRVAMLGELLGSIAHELNQPLAAILSNAQAAQRFLVQGPSSHDEVSQILKDIVDENKRAGDLIRRLRVLFKKGEIQLQPLDANELVRDVLKLMRGDLINRRVAASTELAPRLPEVSGDPVQLQQVLLNLLINAADAAPDGASEVHHILVRTELTNDGEVCISVIDRGRGIISAELARVFEPFVTSKKHGLGLGLTVCRTIVQAHSGRIWAENNAGPGATFRFTLHTMRDLQHEQT